MKKIEVFKTVKNGHFLKGLVHGLCPKIELFLVGVFHRNSIRKKRFWYCGKKIMILSGMNWTLKKGQKMDISKGVSPWILSKNRDFSYLYFSQKICQRRLFLDILNRKHLFKDQKIEFLTRAKKWTFFKGVSPWILSKNSTFSYGYFSQQLCHKKLFWIF